MGSKPRVYLAGPILGCDRGEANDWREYASVMLSHSGVVGISPLRCEPLIGERYTIGSADPKFGTARAISSKNRFDVRACDLTLAYMPKALVKKVPSLGTIIEMAWADMAGKPVVLVSDDPILLEHPVVNAVAGWIVPTLDDGLELIIGILGDYA